jgi:hypothetical protein
MEKQQSFADMAYANRRRKTKMDVFLETMDTVIEWPEWCAAVEPYYPMGKRGRRRFDFQPYGEIFLHLLDELMRVIQGRLCFFACRSKEIVVVASRPRLERSRYFPAEAGGEQSFVDILFVKVADGFRVGFEIFVFQCEYGAHGVKIA